MQKKKQNKIFFSVGHTNNVYNQHKQLLTHDISQHYPVQSTHNSVKQNKNHKRRDQTHQKQRVYSMLRPFFFKILFFTFGKFICCFCPFRERRFFVGEPLRQVHVPPGNVIASLPLTRSALPAVCLQPPPPLSFQ